MKPFLSIPLSRFLSWVLAIAAVLAATAPVSRAQGFGAARVQVQLKGTARTNEGSGESFSATYTIDLPELFNTGDGGSSNGSSGGTVSSPGQFDTDAAYVYLEPGREYSVVTAGSNLAESNVQMMAPPGYVIEMDGVECTSYGGPSKIRILPKTEIFTGRAGSATSLSTGRVYWQVALGALKNSDPGRSLAILDAGTGSNWNDLFIPKGINVQCASADIVVLRTPSGAISPFVAGELRQVVTNEAVVDVVPLTGRTSYEIRFYSRRDGGATQATAGALYTFTGAPYVVYTVARNGGDTALKITRDDRNSSGTSVRSTETTLTRTTNTGGNFVWVMEDWHLTGHSALVVERNEGSVAGGLRYETITRKNQSDVIASVTEKRFASFSWGEELVRTQRGTSGPQSIWQPLVEDLTYHEWWGTGTIPYWSDLRSRNVTGGGWEMYDYGGDLQGRLTRTFRPFVSTPSALPDFSNNTNRNPANWSTSSGELVTRSYASVDFPGSDFGRIASLTTKVNNVETSRSTTDFIDASIVTATRSDWPTSSSTGSKLVTQIRYFREDSSDELLRNQIHSITEPDEVMHAYAYQRGTFDETNKTFSPASDDGAVRVAVIHGTNRSTGNESLTTFSLTGETASYNTQDLYLIAGKSTAEIIIRDKYAHLRRTETYARLSNAWVCVAWETYDYDYANRLVDRKASNGSTYHAVYTNGKLESEEDDTGAKVSFTYDDAGRVSTVTKVNGPTTTFAYDADNRILSETRSATGETSISTSRTYDDAGRLLTRVVAGVGTTSMSYDPATRTRTATAPDGGTRIWTTNLDRRLASLTGTGVVSQYYRYTVDSSGNGWTRVNEGTAPTQTDASVWDTSSLRQRRTKTDHYGRPVKTERAGFGTQTAYTEDASYDDTNGHLTKVARTGLAPLIYAYDDLGEMKSMGLGITNSNGPLTAASSDRLVEFDRHIENDSGYWLSQQTKTYAVDSSGTAVITALSRLRLLTDPTSATRSILEVTDADGDKTTTTTTADATAKTLTVATAHPGFANAEKQIYTNGLLTRVEDTDGLATTFQYDGLDRLWKSTDPRSNVTTSAYYSGTDLLQTVTDAAGAAATTPYAVATYGYTAGRVTSVADAIGAATYLSYNRRGDVLKKWGSGTYPLSFAYDALGQRIAMRTFRAPPASGSFTGTTWPTALNDESDPLNPDPAAWTSGDKTSWAYDPATGLLSSKTDALGREVSYTYNARGQTATRLENGVTTTYSYFGDSGITGPATGELQSITYSDSVTTPLAFEYTRAGQLAKATHGAGNGTDDAGIQTYHYNSTLPQRLDDVALGAFYSNRVLTPSYEASSATSGTFRGYNVGTMKGRSNGFDLGISGNTARDLAVRHSYSDLGRFVGVTGRAGTTAGNSARDFVYSYGPTSWDSYATGLLTGYDVADATFGVEIAYERKRDLFASIDSKWNGASVTRHAYTHDPTGRRVSEQRTGSAYADYTANVSAYSAVYRFAAYNGRGELETDTMYSGNTVPSWPTAPSSADELYGRRTEYRYDQIGNRTSVGPLASSSDDQYAANALNQYSSRENKYVRVVGTAAPSATVTTAPGTGGVNKRDRNWAASLVPDNGNGPVSGSVNVGTAITVSGTTYVKSTDRVYFVPKASQSLSYDNAGNLTNDGVWAYTYDAERRLLKMESQLPVGFGLYRYKLEFKYDHVGRRVEKKVTDLDAVGPDYTRRYVYDGWNLIAETDGSGNILHTYLWGLDLAGSLNATGGVGALLEVTTWSGGGSSQPIRRYFPTRDANGNVSALVRDDGVVSAVYEYGAFGEPTRVEYPSATAVTNDGTLKGNPFRFSSKFTDVETGLVYYGLRYYSPSLGRFINRDPIEEAGGVNLYGFCGNDAVGGIDVLGMGKATDWQASQKLGSPPGDTKLADGSPGNGPNNSQSGPDAPLEVTPIWTDDIDSLGSGPTGVLVGPTNATQSELLKQTLTYAAYPDASKYADWRTAPGNDAAFGLVATRGLPAAIAEGAAESGAVGFFARLNPLAFVTALLAPTPMGNSEIQRPRVKIVEGWVLPEDADADLVSQWFAARGSDPERARRIMREIWNTVSSIRISPSRITHLNPNQINFSQRSVASNVNNYTDAMAAGGWDWEISGPIRVMLRDGQWVTYDNRRLMAAQNVGLTSIPVQIVQPNEIGPGGKTWEQAFQDNRFRDARNLFDGAPIPNTGLPTQPSVRPPRP